MKKIFILMVLGCMSCGSLFAQSKYDVNGDGVVNIADVTAVIAYINGKVKDDTNVSATMIASEKPTWAPASGSTYYSSMCVYVLDNSMPTGLTIAKDDMIYAFIGNECRCAIAPETVNDVLCFKMNISGAESDPAGASVEIRYYSAAKKAYCVANTINYQGSTILGSASKGYALTWK